MARRDKANYLIQAVSHALDVMEELGKASGEIGVTELSKRLKLHKNNVFRLLATLELRGYAEQNPSTEDYRLGVKTLQIGQAYLAQSVLVARSLNVLKNLSEQTGETVSLAVMQNGLIQYPISLESKRPVKVSARNAISISAKQCAAGRLLTGHLSDAVLQEVLAGNTPQDVAIKNQAQEMRATGQIVDKAAIEADVIAVCRVIRSAQTNMFVNPSNPGVDVVAAIEVLIPQYRGANLASVIAQVEEAAQVISTSLGGTKVGQIQTLASSMEREAFANKDS